MIKDSAIGFHGLRVFFSFLFGQNPLSSYDFKPDFLDARI